MPERIAPCRTYSATRGRDAEEAMTEARGSTDLASWPTTVSAALQRAVERNPSSPALVGASGRLTYTQLSDLTEAAAAALWDLGVRPGSRIAASLPNDIDIVVAFYAAMRLGAIWVGVNQVLAPAEKAAILADSGTCLLLSDATTASEVEPLLSGARRSVQTVVADPAGPSPWHERLARSGPRTGSSRLAGQHQANPHAAAVIAYTSGTSGRPKGVVLSQASLLLPGAVLAASRGYDESLSKGDNLPLTIANLMLLGPLLTAQTGGCFVAIDTHAASAANWIRTEQITVWNGVPAMLFDMAHRSEVSAEDLTSLSEVWTGGSGCPESLYAAFADRFSIELTSTYGLTEAPSIVAIQPRGYARVPGASGVPLGHLDVAALDERGQRVPAGGDGEICVRPSAAGPWTDAYRPMLGYWNNEQATRGALNGGWLHTGDVGHVSETGFLFVIDRKNNMIIRGGANIYPAEVEQVINALDGVTESVVVGMPDERLGERVVAVVVRSPGSSITADEIIAECRRTVARYKVPERVTFVTGLPRNAMGKVRREAVRGRQADR
jgi:long-chain acyl-CoA synthetase